MGRAGGTARPGRPSIAWPWTVTADGIMVAVRLTPKGGRDAIDGVEALADGRAVLKAKVRAVASDGKANEALMALIAKALGVARRDVSLAALDACAGRGGLPRAHGGAVAR